MFEGLSYHLSFNWKLILITIVKDIVDEECNFNEKFGDKVKLL